MIVELRGNVDDTLRSQMQDAVKAYGSENPGVSHADDVELSLIGPDGKECKVQGAFQRDVVGNLVFIALGIVGKFLKGATERLFKREGRGPNARRAARKDRSKREGTYMSIYSGGLPDTPEERLAFLLGNDILKKQRDGSYHMSGGRKFADKKAVLAHLAELPATESGDTSNPLGGASKAKAEDGKANGRSTPATKVAKKAAKKAVKAATKAATKATKKRR